MSQPRSLLLIEDDDTTLAVLTVLLQQDGWNVSGASSGEHALSVLHSGATRPEVILCDQNLPGLEGPALATALRAAHSPERLIAMSASITGQVPDGYDALLVKPFGPQALNDALQDLACETDPASLPGRAVLSTQTHAQLEAQMGKSARELYTFALADADKRLQRMDAAVRGDDPALFTREAHALKGSAGMIGAERLAFLAANAETATGMPQHETVQEMRLACAEIRRMLEELYSA